MNVFNELFPFPNKMMTIIGTKEYKKMFIHQLCEKIPLKIPKFIFIASCSSEAKEIGQGRVLMFFCSSPSQKLSDRSKSDDFA